jgi:general secretion pathway protein K
MSQRYAQTQRGIALITALLIVALATTAAAQLASTHQLSIRRTANMINTDQAWLYALAAEAAAMIVLNTDKDLKLDSRNDVWYKAEINNCEFKLPANGRFIGKITDMESRFNLNSILNFNTKQMDPYAVEIFKNLIEPYGIDRSAADAVVDWLDPDVNATVPEGAEDLYYMSLPSPYRAANEHFGTVSELRMVKGFGPLELKNDVFNQLAKQLSAHPLFDDKKININTATPEVLQALGVDPTIMAPTQNPQTPGSTPNPAKPANAAGNCNPPDPTQYPEFTSVQDFIQKAGSQNLLSFLQKPQTAAQYITVQSKYFLFEGTATADRAVATLTSQLSREDSDGSVRLQMRSQGGL